MKKVFNILVIALILTILWILFLLINPNFSEVKGIKSVKTEYDNYYAEIDKKIEKEFDKNPKKLYEKRKANLKRVRLNLDFGRARKYLEDSEYIFGFSSNGKLVFVLKKNSPNSNNGVLKYLYDNQSLKEIGYVEGKDLVFSGKLQSFNKEGTLITERQYYQGRLEGLEKVFSEDGKLEEERMYKNGLIDEEEIYYYEDGKIAQKSQYIGDKKEGKSISYYENGEILAEISYKNNKRDGAYFLYYENGIKKEEGYFKNDKLEGISKLYYESGKILQIAYNKNGKKDGRIVKYYEMEILNMNGIIKMMF